MPGRLQSGRAQSDKVTNLEYYVDGNGNLGPKVDDALIERSPLATFRVYFRRSNGEHGDTVVEAMSSLDSLKVARQAFPNVTFTRVWVVDDSITATLNCPKCHIASVCHFVWGAATEATVSCQTCGNVLRLFRERVVVSGQASQVASCSTPPILGQVPQLSNEHIREPSKSDRLRAIFEKPEVVTWDCRACKVAINCDWHERMDVQDCPNCGCKQYVRSSAFAWNARLMREREMEQRAADYALQQKRRDQEASEKRRMQEAEAARHEQEQQHQLMLSQLADIAVGAGLIESREAFRYLNAESIAGIKALSDCADALHTDLMSAMDDNVLAEKAVAHGRPAAAAASIVSMLAGYGWAGVAFGAIAVGARWMSNDWKRAQLAEYQAKWGKLFSTFSAEEMRAFTAVFAYKYPMLASMAAGMHGRLPS